MNIALSTLLIFFFLLPGLAYRRFYYTGEFSKEYFKTTPFEIIFLSIIPSAIIHLIGYNCSHIISPINFSIYSVQFVIPDLEIDFALIGSLLMGKGTDNSVSNSFNQIGEYINHIILYNLLLIFLGSAMGFITKAFVRSFKLDRRFKILRFQNEWHYILSSEILDFPKVKRNANVEKENGELNAVWIDALVELDGDSSILYSGVLEDYQLSKSGSLDTIYLTNTSRRFMKDDENGQQSKNEPIKEKTFSVLQGPYYNLPDHYFVIKYNEVKNINIYYDFEEYDELEEDLELSIEDVKESISNTRLKVIGVISIVLIYAILYIMTKSWVNTLIIGTVIITLIARLGNLRNNSDKNEEEEENSENEQQL